MYVYSHRNGNLVDAQQMVVITIISLDDLGNISSMTVNINITSANFMN